MNQSSAKIKRHPRLQNGIVVDVFSNSEDKVGQEHVFVRPTRQEAGAAALKFIREKHPTANIDVEDVIDLEGV